MKRHLKNLWTIIVYIFSQSIITDGEFNLYDNDAGRIINSHDYDCLFIPSDGVTEVKISSSAFCIRPDTHINMDNHRQHICFGERISFQQLKSKNVLPSDLFASNANTKTIESYSKYLILRQDHYDNASYCRCSSPIQFGEQCQYELDDISMIYEELDFTRFLMHGLSIIYARSLEDMTIQYVTCFIGIPCQNSFMCLDWRQICNGIVDCDHGDDEILSLCSQIELNQCDSRTEFRCQNGMCIPMDVRHDGETDCLDQTDEITATDKELKIFHNIFYSSEFAADEITCSSKQYSCANGQCISYTDAVTSFMTDSDRCQNQRNIMEMKQLFAPRSNSNENFSCWASMLCLTGFAELYSNVKCTSYYQNLATDIQQHCPNQFFFPYQPVVYSFVHFFYEKINQRQWSTYTGPDYICYQKSFCLNHPLMSTTVSKKNMTCFTMNHTIFSWTNFYEYVLHLFSSCYSTFSNTLVTDKMTNPKELFRCHLSNTFITNDRVKNQAKDCYFGEDEYPWVDFCALNTKDKFHCLNNRSECIHERFVSNQQKDCADGSDELYTSLENPFAFTFQTNRYPESKFFYLYVFSSLCNQVVDYHLTWNQMNETDETHCEYWPYLCYNSPYTACNEIWNCQNGLDEMNCSPRRSNNLIVNAFKCNAKFEHYCIQFINNRTDVKTTCIHVNRTGDGIIDCIGATDERFSSVCTNKYPSDFRRRFHCMNSNVCITAEQVCDRIIDCPFEDDELTCPWLYHSNATTFHCKNAPSKTMVRCEGTLASPAGCSMREHAWFCDLSPKSIKYHRGNHLENFDWYPVVNQTQQTKSIESITFHSELPFSHRMSASSSSSSSLVNTTLSIWSCNHGYPIKSSISIKGYLCLCPKTFYGDYCQYQAERITVFAKIRHVHYFHPTKVFRLIFYLLNEDHNIVSYEEIVYNHKENNDRFYVLLPYERLINTSLYERMRSKIVRIDSYAVEKTHVQYISSWLYDVSFPFLPVNRLSVVINLEDEVFLRLVRCKKKKCGVHGKCMYYLNVQHKEYCRCDHGWYGDRCHLKLPADLCNTKSCASHSLCVVLNPELKRIQCICPLGSLGDQCYIASNLCPDDACQNNGTCLPLEQRASRYVCICSKKHKGRQCEERMPTVNIFIGTEIASYHRIPAATVMTGISLNSDFIQKRGLHTNIDLPAILNVYDWVNFGLIQIFHNFSTSFYYMIAMLDRRYVSLNTSVIEANRCENISRLFNKTILNNYSYLRRLKLYHLPCHQNRKLRCFFDEYRMCFCKRDGTSSCVFFHHVIANCDYCQNNGLCLQEDKSENEWKYVCLCAPCSFGSLCQFSTGNYYITVDVLVGKLIRPGIHSFSQQPKIILIVFIILFVILVFSLISNVISFIILFDRKLQQVGCDLYLLVAVLISELGIIALFFRYLYMIIIQTYVIENVVFMKVTCVLLEYLIRLIPSLFDWLIACISIERTYMIIKDIRFTKLLASQIQRMARWIVLLMILLNILSTLHRPFYVTLVGEPIHRGGLMRHPWCILQFDSNGWNVYEKFINIFHLAVPFSLNLISIICFIFHRTKLELASSLRNHKRKLTLIIQQQLLKYKTILIGTIFIILMEIPRLVLTLIYDCAHEQLHKNVYLFGYLVSYLPLTSLFFIYVLPSPKYQNRFRKILRENRLTSGLIDKK